MGLIWSNLTLHQPNRADGTHVEFPKLPPGLSAQLEQGSRVLDAGLLVGEKLGLELTELADCLNEVCLAKHRGRGLFTDDHIPILLEGYTRIQKALRSAIDDQGRPVGSGGKRLESSSSIEWHGEGEMVTRVRRVRLIELLGWLDEFLHFLTFAQTHGLFMSNGDFIHPDSVDHKEQLTNSTDQDELA